jgi:hypothetical protein
MKKLLAHWKEKDHLLSACQEGLYSYAVQWSNEYKQKDVIVTGNRKDSGGESKRQ